MKKSKFLVIVFLLPLVVFSVFLSLPVDGVSAFEAALTSEAAPLTQVPAAGTASQSVSPSLTRNIFSWTASAVTVSLIIYSYFMVIKLLAGKRRRNYKELELMR